MRDDLWSEACTAELRVLFDQGLSASQIGLRVGRSRCAVIGKLNRMGLHRFKAQPHLGVGRARSIRGAVGRQMAIGIRSRKRDRGAIGVEALPGKPAPGHEGVSLLDVKFGQCRYPIDREGGPFFCGAPTLVTKSWCPCHFALCTLPPRPGEREAVRRLGLRFA